jgi:hypothetical protein
LGKESRTTHGLQIHLVTRLGWFRITFLSHDPVQSLSDISVAQVLQAVDRIELRKPTEMETEIVDI